MPWMENSIVGQFKEVMDVDQLGEEFVKGGLNRVSIVRMDGFKLEGGG